MVGPTLGTASFAASRVARLRNPQLGVVHYTTTVLVFCSSNCTGCDLTAYRAVLSQYAVLVALGETYAGLEYDRDNLQPGLQPCTLKHNVRSVSKTKFVLFVYLEFSKGFFFFNINDMIVSTGISTIHTSISN